MQIKVMLESGLYVLILELIYTVGIIETDYVDFSIGGDGDISC